MGTKERFSLEGRRVLVTGAAGGIGGAIVTGALELGAEVVATDRRAPAIADARVRAAALDLGDATGIEADLAELAGDRGLDVVIHAAGLLRRVPSLDLVTEEDWDAQHDVNLKAAFFLVRAAADLMPAGGSIVLFTSQGWWTGGYGGSIAYNAAKGGLVSLLRGFARELAPRGIRVNGVAPGAVDTPMLTEGLDPEVLAAFLAQIPLGRIADPAEMADVALFLATDAARYLTGATINATGGQLIY